MLCEMFAVGSDQTANELALIPKTFQQRSRHRVKVPEVDQRLGESGA